jgi:hypothetical protein
VAANRYCNQLRTREKKEAKKTEDRLLLLFFVPSALSTPEDQNSAHLVAECES